MPSILIGNISNILMIPKLQSMGCESSETLFIRDHSKGVVLYTFIFCASGFEADLI